MAFTDNLIGYWNLDEASGTRNDSTANANHMTDVNTVTGTTGPGSHNASLFTLANSERLDHADNAMLSVGDIDFTICGWVKFTSLNDAQAIAGHGSSSSTRAWKIYQSTTGPAIRGYVSNDGSAVNVIPAGTPIVSTGVWYFFVFWHDSVVNTANMQVNNGTASSVAHSTGVFDSSGVFDFGSMELAFFLDGALAMIGFWKRTLTAGEKTTLYNSGNGLSYAEMLATEATPGIFPGSSFTFLRRGDL